MPSIGQKVQLWGFEISRNLIRVIDDITVTITETMESEVQIAATGDGVVWEKHGNSWFCHAERMHPQSMIDSIEVYAGIRNIEGRESIRLVDKSGNPIVPTGDDIEYCKKHDCYSYKTRRYSNPCLFCRMDEQDRQRATA